MLESIWCHVWLDDVADVLDDYELWKDAPWFHEVDWELATQALVEVFQRKADQGVVDGLLDEIELLRSHLRTVDFQGIVALVQEPITVTPVQLTNGGHRMAAMRRQGVRSVPGLFVRDDVGESIHRDQVYPTTATNA